MRKLTKEHIPEGYVYAAVDESGNSYAFKTKPTLRESVWWPRDVDDTVDYIMIGNDFDNTDWQNSLVENLGNISDGYHTFEELYEYRMLYNALSFNLLHEKGIKVEKSLRHSDGELCFGGGWFIVVAELPGVGQISNHYEVKDWDLFKVSDVETPSIAYDGHTPKDVTQRLYDFLKLTNV
jgi:hypothetical protein